MHTVGVIRGKALGEQGIGLRASKFKIIQQPRDRVVDHVAARSVGAVPLMVVFEE